MYLSAYAESARQIVRVRDHETIEHDTIERYLQEEQDTVKFPGYDRCDTYTALEYILFWMSQDERSNKTAVTPTPNSDSSLVHKVQGVTQVSANRKLFS